MDADHCSPKCPIPKAHPGLCAPEYWVCRREEELIEELGERIADFRNGSLDSYAFAEYSLLPVVRGAQKEALEDAIVDLMYFDGSQENSKHIQTLRQLVRNIGSKS